MLTYNEPDFLAVGCFAWARAKTAREAYRICRANASPNLIKPEFRKFRVWRLPDQVDEVTVDDMGGWRVTKAAEGHEEALKQAWEPLLVFIGLEVTPVTRVPELPTEPYC